jgi:hypothetical protein
MHALAVAVVIVVVGWFAQVSPGAGPGHGGPIDRRAVIDLKLADPIVKSAGGKVDKMIVKRYLRRELTKFRYCYEKSLVVNPEVRGTLSIRFTVLPDGRLTGVRVEGIANDVANCVAAFVRRMQLPKLPEEAEVRAKIQLKPAPPRPRHPPGHGCGGLNCGRLGSCGARSCSSPWSPVAATTG